MTNEEKLETKEKIIQVASDLFSRFGFEGTSIRDIASKSDVNVASINYHFGNKQNLYWLTVTAKHEWLEKGMEDLANKYDDVAELIVQAYHFLMQDPSAIRTALKMMLTDGVPEPEGAVREEILSQVGPPGATHILKVLKKQIPEGVSESAMMWAMKSLFAGLLHWAMLSASCKAELMREKHPELVGEGIDEILRHHSRAIIEYVQHHADLEVNPGSQC